MQLTNEPAEELAQLLVDTSKGAFHAVGFVSGGLSFFDLQRGSRASSDPDVAYLGSEAMEATIKLAKQYYFEINQPQRTNFIARKLSFHGNTVGTLSLGHHPARRLPYESLLQRTAFHHVSPAYALRYKNPDESDEAYVQRLANELEAKFQELGPETVIGCEVPAC
jgi:E3 ubiquitin-protein ligase TRIP12